MKMIFAYGNDKPHLGRDVFVAENATVLGKVSLGDESSVWYGCVVRGDVGSIHIGSRTNIQDLSVVHVTTDKYDTWIGNNVTVGHRVMLHGCTIEARCLIGMGAIILDGAVIGEGSLIGAGALITPRTEVPPGSMVLGSPGRVVKTLSEAEQREFSHAAVSYVEIAKRHRMEVAPI